MVVGMLVIGNWVTGKIQANVTANSAQATALFMDSYISPLAQELDKNDTLSIGPIRALGEILEKAPLRDRVVSIKIWKPGGLVAYSNNLDLIGQRFEPTESLRKAWIGSVVAEFDDLEHEENELDRRSGVPLLEIYSPIREPWSGRIIGVAEFYENATDLQNALREARIQSWLLVGVVTLGMALSLYGIVHSGSRLIERQRESLQMRIAESSRVAEQNRLLRQRVERASARISELNEQYLRRISAELHDGPAQLISLAALRLDSLKDERDGKPRNTDIETVRNALNEAMRDIRNICNGLTLPEIENQDLDKTIREIATGHERRTDTEVDLEVELSGSTIPYPVKICAYRFVQEGLNNAFRHAGGADQKVEAVIEDGSLRITVSDGGSACKSASGSRDGLGLAGLRERVESLGGTFSFSTVSAQGSRLSMSVGLEGERFEG